MRSHRKPLLALASLTLLFSLSLAMPTLAIGASSKAKPAAGGKKTGFNGDPAKKRGLEIGFDQGQKAGKGDLEKKLSPDPNRHDEFNKPEKFFRFEYGSQAAFSSGFRSGFVGGYQAAYGKKVKVSASASGGTSTSGSPSAKPKTAASSGGGKKSSGGGSSDAL